VLLAVLLVGGSSRAMLASARSLVRYIASNNIQLYTLIFVVLSASIIEPCCATQSCHEYCDVACSQIVLSSLVFKIDVNFLLFFQSFDVTGCVDAQRHAAYEKPV